MKKLNKNLIISFSIIFFLSIIVVASLIIFQYTNKNKLLEQNREYVESTAVQEGRQVEYSFSLAEATISNTSAWYALLIKNGMGTEEALKELAKETIFDRIGFVDKTGKDFSVEGTATVSDRYYFIEGMKGNVGKTYLEKSRITGKSSIVFYSPVYFNSSSTEPDGVLIGHYHIGTIDEIISYKMFDIDSIVYLTNKEGTVVSLSKGASESGNLLDRLDELDLIKNTNKEDIMKFIDSPDSSMSFFYKEGRSASIVSIYEFQDGEWFLWQILPADVTSSMLSKLFVSNYALIIVISVVFILFGVFLLFTATREQKRLEIGIEKAVKETEETYKKISEQYAIMKSLGQMYFCSYYVNLSDFSFYEIKSIPYFRDMIANVENAKDVVYLWITQAFDNQNKEKAEEFFDFDNISEKLKNGNSMTIELNSKLSGWIRSSIIVVAREEEKIQSILIVVEQIDEERKKELMTKQALEDAYAAANAANLAKTNFLSNMSHDIRTPMNAIIGMTAIAGAHIDDKNRVLDCLNKITISSKHLLGLINEVLDMSKIESGKIDLYDESFDLSKLIDGILNICGPQIREKEHDLHVSIEKVIHESVIGDEMRVQQIFMNLVTNAIKYTPKKGHINVTLREKQTNKSKIACYEFIVEDNGIGMSDEDIAHVFEPFVRAKDTRVEKIQGTGLGLPIARNIAKMMNGDISIESTLGVGSKFTATIFLKIDDIIESNYDEFIDLNVLVCDDDIMTCECSVDILNSLGMNASWVLSGREAIEDIRKNRDKYYAIVIDWKMPEMNGIETAKEIRKIVGNDVPIIIISAYDFSEIEEEAKAAGVNAFVAKPLFKSRLIHLFHNLIHNEQEVSLNNSLEDYADENLFKNKKALLVEDNELNMEIAKEILSMTGIKIETAMNGQEAVDIALQSKENYYDIIFMDIQMPILDGYGAAKKIRESDRHDLKKVPIIAMTANAFAEDVRSAISCGMNEHISKPLDFKKLLQILKKYL